MAQYNWLTCPATVKEQILRFQSQLQALLDNNLVGLYLHGSLAMGCFNHERSDIDLLVVTVQGMSVETKRNIVELLLHSSQAPTSIEISFLIEQAIHPFQHPLPFDLHYSESWRNTYLQQLTNGEWKRWNDITKKDTDLSAHITIMLSRGITLYGKSIEEVFPVVPTQSYLASIMADFRDARDGRTTMPVYFILNACRIYACLLEGHIFSKDEGGAWALHILPESYHSVVQQALNIYRGNDQFDVFHSVALNSFSTYINSQIQLLLKKW